MMVKDKRPVGAIDTLASFVVTTDSAAIPPDALATAVRGVIDFTGVAIAGATIPAVTPLREYVDSVSASGSSTALGCSRKITAEGASFLNGAVGHVLDFDDCSDLLGGHPTVAVLPAALAVAEAEGSSARETLAAYSIGVEVVSAIGCCMNFRHYERGWHPTATIGIFGAVAAASRLLRLDVDATARAFAIAASFSSGIKGSFGTLMKPGQVGAAGSNGVAAAKLSALGVSANRDIFDSGQSFGKVYNGEDIDWSPLDTLGRDWRMASSGLVFKLYPCCGSTHAPIDAVLTVMEKNKLDARDIEAIDVYVHPRRIPHTDRPEPGTGTERRFSLQYGVAVAAAKGAVTLGDFTEIPPVASLVSVQDLMKKVRLHALPENQRVILPMRSDCLAAEVTVQTYGGVRYEHFIECPRGSDPRNPLSDAALHEKFVATSASSIGSEDSSSILNRLKAWTDGRGTLSDLMSQINETLVRSKCPAKEVAEARWETRSAPHTMWQNRS